MCMGCMSNADFLLTSGILGVASVKAGALQLLPPSLRRTRPVTDEEADAFMASLMPSAPTPAAPDPVPDPVVDPGSDPERSRVLAER